MGRLVQHAPVLERIFYVPPPEYEARYHEQLRGPATIDERVAAGYSGLHLPTIVAPWGLL